MMPTRVKNAGLTLAASLLAADEKSVDESVTASATRSSVPRVGIVASSFAGGEEHDGTKISGLAEPCPIDAALTDAQLDALVVKAMDLGQLIRSSRRGSRRRSSSEDWVVVLIRGEDGPPGSGTDPRVARTVVRTMAELGQGKRFTIARGSATKIDGFSDDWQRLVADMKRQAPAARFELLDLNDDEWLEAPTFDRHLASRNPKGLYAVARTIRQCDRVVSLAPLATDALTGVALAASNYWGVAPGSVYGYPKKKLLELGTPGEVLLDLYLHQPSRSSIVGGSMGVEGDGESTLRHNVIIAGRSTTAVDAVGAAVMGFDPENLPYLKKFVRRGLGVRDPYSIWTSGCYIDDVVRQFDRPAQWKDS
jgi:uncharacterized protein (DUF362 family)